MRLPGISFRLFRTLFYALLVAGGVALGLYLNSSPPSEDQLKETLITSLQEEADTTVFITGYLTISTRLTLEETRHFTR